MHRFFIDREARPGERLVFPGPVSRQMVRVLRLDAGTRVIAVDPDGWELTVEITRADPRAAEGRVLARERRATEPPVRVVLAQGLPKADKMDWVVQKCTEAGVGEILPVLTARTVANPAGKEEARRERWRRIAREAAEQSGRAAVPEIGAVCDLAAAAARLGALDLFLVPWEEEEARGIRAVLRGAAASPAPPRSVGILIGPEGGLTREEVDLVRRRGAVPVTLGPRLLRTETAGLVTLVTVLYELGDLG